jgi:tetratricopeptide (TPR) repeat protein
MDVRKKTAFFSLFFCLTVITLSYRLSGVALVQKKPLYYLPSVQYLSSVSGTFKPIVAEMMFIKGVLELTDEIPGRVPYLINVFRTAVYLDPKLMSAYFFGGTIVPVKKADIPLGNVFLEEAASLNPGDWRIPFWIGFNYLQLGEYLKAAEYYQKSSLLPGAPAYLKTNQAMFYYKAGKAEMGLVYLESLAQTITDERLMELFKKKIDWLKNIVFLEGKTRKFKELFGFWPKDLNELVQKGLIEKVPDDPFGRGYQLDKNWEKNPGKIRSVF